MSIRVRSISFPAVQHGGLGFLFAVAVVALLAYTSSVPNSAEGEGPPHAQAWHLAMGHSPASTSQTVRWGLSLSPSSLLQVSLFTNATFQITNGSIDAGTSLPGSVRASTAASANLSLTVLNVTGHLPIPGLGTYGPIQVPGLAYGFLGVQLGVFVSVRSSITANCTSPAGVGGCTGSLLWTSPGARNFSVTAAANASPGESISVTLSSISYSLSLNVTAGGTVPFVGQVLVPILPLLPLGSFLGAPSAVSGAYVVTAPPRVLSLTTSDNSVAPNATLTLRASTSGGSGPLAYRYSGLPPGCATSNTSSLPCTPVRTGDFNISVTVADPQQETSHGNLTLRVVNPPPPATRTTSLSGGAASSWLWVAGGAGVAVAAIVAIALVRRQRRAKP